MHAKHATQMLLPLCQSIIDKAFDYEGVRYRRGGTSQKGMDCSGLVYICFLAYGIALPRSSADMADSVDDISRHEAKAGDLVFFKTNRRKGRVNHVGLVTEAINGELKFIHASVRNGVTVSSTAEGYYARAFVKVGRVARG
jgi:cell wall-associated NlpC family hydrolase